MKELVSVIVPVYNVEKYLSECIDSIRQQTYKNIEILIIDDGSTDGSANICDKFAQVDNRIKVIHKKNGGLSDARNVGICAASGEYLSFIDSDDYIESDMIECLYNSCIGHHADISICGRVCEIEGSENNFYLFTDFFGVLTSTEAVKDLLVQKNCDSAAWDKLYKADLFTNIRYPKGVLHEDLNVTVQLLAQCRNVAYIDKALYHYRIRNGSICNQFFSEKKFDLYTQSCLTRDFINNNFRELSKEADFFVWRNVIALLYNAKKSVKCDKSQIRRMRKILMSESRRAVNNQYIAVKDIVKAYKDYSLIKYKSLI